jgi:hypothetical protein
VRNEEEAIAEWMAYHLGIGFDTLLVYDNGSTDETPQLIAKMSEVGDVRCREWHPRTPRWQAKAYEDAIERFGAEFEWLFFIDADEFVLPLTHRSIHSVMATFTSDVAAVAFNWLMYGSSGLERQPEGSLVIEAFQRHSEPEWQPNGQVKSAVRPYRALSCINPHMFEVRGRYVLADGRDVVWHSDGAAENPPRGGEAARINHYFTKSRQQWEAKVERTRGSGDGDRDPMLFDVYDRNEVQDDLILQYLEPTRGLMAKAGV